MFIKTGENIATFGSNVATFLRVIIPTSRHSRMWKCQHCDIGIQCLNIPESPLSQHRDVEIQRQDVPKHVEIQCRDVPVRV